MPNREQFRARTEEIAEAHRAVPVSAEELKRLRERNTDLAAALKDARNQLYEERHPTMSEMEFLASVSIIDAALKKAGIE